MIITYRRNVSGSYMVIEEQENDRCEEYALHMLLKNSIEGFLQPAYEEMNGKRRLLYDISRLYSLNSLFELKKMTGPDLSFFLESLRNAAKRLEEYLLDPDLVMLDPENIFAEYETGRFWFCACPFPAEERNAQNSELADMIISSIDYSDVSLVKTAYRVNIAFNSRNFSLADLPDLTELQKEPESCMPGADELHDICENEAEHRTGPEKDPEPAVVPGYSRLPGYKEKIRNFIREMF